MPQYLSAKRQTKQLPVNIFRHQRSKKPNPARQGSPVGCRPSPCYLHHCTLQPNLPTPNNWRAAQITLHTSKTSPPNALSYKKKTQRGGGFGHRHGWFWTTNSLTQLIKKIMHTGHLWTEHLLSIWSYIEWTVGTVDIWQMLFVPKLVSAHLKGFSIFRIQDIHWIVP